MVTDRNTVALMEYERQQEEKMTLQEQKEKNALLSRRLADLAAAARELTREMGVKITLATEYHPEYEGADRTSSAMFIDDGYRLDHFARGNETLSYKHWLIDPEQLEPGKAPLGMEALVEEYEEKRKK